MTEIWKTIPFESAYEASTLGRIRNINSEHIKSLREDRYGYARVTLYPSGKTYTIHRLVAGTLLPKKEEHTQVNHIDGDKQNNRVVNLEWCDASHNCRHRDTILQSKWKGSMNPQAVLTSDLVRKIKYGDFSNKNNREIGDEFCVSAEQVRRIRSNQRWKHI